MPNIDCVINELKKEGVPFEQNILLANYTTFKIGGNARIFCTPRTVQELASAIQISNKCGVRRYILGKGSNILFSDNGFDGVIINITSPLDEISINESDGGGEITAFAGATLSKVCTFAAENSLAGLEFAYGIPGNIGGAVYMNAGAYGGEMKDVLKSVTFLDENSKLRELAASELALGYRTSIFESENWCIVKAVFSLKTANKSDITNKMKELAKKRVEKQPLDMPSAGSTFKRPVGGFAGALIEQCGLKGYSVGGAQISTKHCGFVVNKGGATCEDVLKLADDVCKKVTEDTGIALEKEIRVVE